jgi:hypothetical protein
MPWVLLEGLQSLEHREVMKMNPKLKKAFNKTVSIFENDPRVVAAYHSGSVGTDREDEFSDVDPVFLIKSEEFIAFDEGLKPLFEREIAKTVLWWPERWIWAYESTKNMNIPRNYAIFFEMDDELIQYDINIMIAPQKGHIKVSKDQFIFDKVNILEIVSDHPLPELDKRKLVWNIEMYWIYVYIHTKYIKRRDLFKLLYAQQELFHEHKEVLKFLGPNTNENWWPLVAKKVERKENLLKYFEKADVDLIVEAMKEQIKIFSMDARLACARWELEYPEKFESLVISHLKKNGILT